MLLNSAEYASSLACSTKRMQLMQDHRVKVLGAVHILRQPKSGVSGPPLPPPSAMVSIWLTPPPPFVSFRQHLPETRFGLQTLTMTF